MSKSFIDLKLNNGKTATFMQLDDWYRPVYKIQMDNGKEAIVCCTELLGVYLHTYSPFNNWQDGEPCSPLKHDYQPVRDITHESLKD